MIKPTIGRIVWFHDGVTTDEREHPLAAIVTHVHSNSMVNLAVFDPNGVPFGRTSVHLQQSDEEALPIGMYCRWMPYQKIQAEKTQLLADSHTHGQHGR